MSKGILALSATINAAFDLTEAAVKIRSAGLSSAVSTLLPLVAEVEATIKQVSDLVAEAQDLDGTEIQALTALIFQRVRQLLVLLGVAQDSKVSKALSVAPKALALAATVYEQGKEIYDEVAA